MPVIEKAKVACKNSGHKNTDHFEDYLDMVDIGSGAKHQLENMKLSRYACYGDSSRPVIANGRTYFVIQTRGGRNL